MDLQQVYSTMKVVTSCFSNEHGREFSKKLLEFFLQRQLYEAYIKADNLFIYIEKLTWRDKIASLCLSRCHLSFNAQIFKVSWCLLPKFNSDVGMWSPSKKRMVRDWFRSKSQKYLRNLVSVIIFYEEMILFTFV